MVHVPQLSVLQIVHADVKEQADVIVQQIVPVQRVQAVHVAQMGVQQIVHVDA